MFSTLLVDGLERLGSAFVGDDGGAGFAPGDAAPVVLVGGLATTAPLLDPMSAWLTGLGHTVHPFCTGAGLDCAQRTVDTLVDEVRAVAAAAGRPVVLLGHSRGGQFARAAAARAPEDVAGLITLGTPFALFRLGAPTLLAATALAAAGTAGLPGITRLSCLFGGCCREFRAQLRAPWPSGTPFTSIYSGADRVVPARASHDDDADCVEVPGSHLQLLTGRTARTAVAAALGRCATPALASAS